MPPASEAQRPAPRSNWFAAPLFFAGLALFVLLPNPALDLLVSVVCEASLGLPIRFHGLHPTSWKSATFGSAYVLLQHEKEPALIRRGGVRLNPDAGVLRFWAREIEWQGVHAGSKIRGGALFKERRLSKLSTALWVPQSVWSGFPQMIDKRFARDADNRRFFKLSYNEGLWRVWGRSAPVLEARWS